MHPPPCMTQCTLTFSLGLSLFLSDHSSPLTHPYLTSLPYVAQPTFALSPCLFTMTERHIESVTMTHSLDIVGADWWQITLMSNTLFHLD